jgi:hypothetical protein
MRALISLSLLLGSVAVLPPGFEDMAWCPTAEHCLRRKHSMRLFAGPRSAFFECHHPPTNEQLPAVWTGNNTDVTPPLTWVVTSEEC